MKQVKEDMEFQIEGLLYINREIEKTVTHAKKKAKEFAIKNTQQQQLRSLQHIFGQNDFASLSIDCI